MAEPVSEEITIEELALGETGRGQVVVFISRLLKMAMSRCKEWKCKLQQRAELVSCVGGAAR
jgi:hypothetical protein